MLAEHVEPHDVTGQWMSHHLAELIEAAKDEAKTTPEQRIQIVETILKLWMARRAFPGHVPGGEFDTVFAALDRLADDSPWAFSRLSKFTKELPEPESTDLPLIATAADLDRLARESVITLIALAFEGAFEANGQWIDAGEALQANLENELSSVVTRIQRRLDTLQAFSEDDPFEPSVDQEPTPETTAVTPSKEERENPMSNYNHARRLRKMSELLDKIANALHPSID
jgi:hypothetical protein